MALDGDRLGQAIIDAVNAVVESYTGETPDSSSLRIDMFKAIGNAIVEEIRTNAQVSTSVAVASVSGVTTGAGVSGPGTGTGTGNIT